MMASAEPTETCTAARVVGRSSPAGRGSSRSSSATMATSSASSSSRERVVSGESSDSSSGPSSARRSPRAARAVSPIPRKTSCTTAGTRGRFSSSRYPSSRLRTCAIPAPSPAEDGRVTSSRSASRSRCRIAVVSSCARSRSPGAGRGAFGRCRASVSALSALRAVRMSRPSRSAAISASAIRRWSSEAVVLSLVPSSRRFWIIMALSCSRAVCTRTSSRASSTSSGSASSSSVWADTNWPTRARNALRSRWRTRSGVSTTRTKRASALQAKARARVAYSPGSSVRLTRGTGR